MPKFPLIGPSYTSQSVNADCQTTMNLYPEVIESGAGNNQIVLYPAPGTKQFVELNPSPPPPAHLNPEIINANLFAPFGSNSGNSRINVPVAVNAIHVGDTLYLCFAGTVAPAAPYNPIVSVTSPMLLAGTFNQLGPTFDMGLTNLGYRFYQVFYAKAENAVAGSSLLVNINMTSDPQSNFDIGGSLLLVRNLDSLDQVTSSISTFVTRNSAPLTFSSDRFLVTFIGSAQGVVTIPNPPYFKLTGGVGNNLAGIAAYFYLDPSLGDIFVAAAGTYQPTWTQVNGPFNVPVITAAFTLKPV